MLEVVKVSALIFSGIAIAFVIYLVKLSRSDKDEHD